MIPGEDGPRRPAGRVSAAARVLMQAAVLLCIGMVALSTVQLSARRLGPSDVFWQVRTGEIALQTGHVPDADPFSYTIHGRQWNNHEWLFELGAALLHRAFGWGAIRLMVLALVAAAGIGLGVTVARRAGAAAALLVLTLFLIFASYKFMPVPQTVSMVLFLLALCLFRGPLLLSSRPRAAALALYMLVWGNLTAEVLSFLPILFVDQACLWQARRRAGRPLPVDRLALRLAALAAVTPLLNPPWSSVLDYVLNGTAVNRIVNTEFTHLWEPAKAVIPYAKHVAIGVICLYLAWAGAVLRRARDRWARSRTLGVGLLAVAGAALFERNLWLLVIPAAQMTVAARAWARSQRRWMIATGATTLLSAGLFLGFVGWSWTPAVPIHSFLSPRYRHDHLSAAGLPLECVALLAQEPEGTRVYTLRMWASYVIWRAPHVLVFGDGRNLEYPLALYYAGAEIWEGGPHALQILDATRTQVVIADPGWNELPGIRGGPWRLAAKESNCAVFKRSEAP